MKKIGQWIITIAIFYFWINAMADNPREVEAFRRQMNSFVDKGIDAARRLIS